MTTLFIPKEQTYGEQRVAATPDSVKRLVSLGARVVLESGAGLGSQVADSEYEKTGASIGNDIAVADIVLCVRTPSANLLSAMKPGAILVGMLDPYTNRASFDLYNSKKISAFSMELLPRISRAQSMDVLSSQSNLAGYRAVIEAVHMLGKAAPMMMTAAGTVAAAKVLVLGAGVAGLQAIATAKRLGAIVSAFDVRPAVKEQVESLGAKFIEVPAEGAETSGGYAKEMSDDYKQKQSKLIADTIAKQDIVITTALIPGKPAPTLITQAMVEGMKSGSVIVDLAAERGGNCPLTKADETVQHHGVTILGATNLPSRVAADASQLYARNLYHFISTLMLSKDGLSVKWDDELIKGTLLTRDGIVINQLILGGA
ncbi:MAG: Re/Si-specific NAD(P)(+) transhydrogenase subunit alpha [Rickettsiales bacterium]|jgi:NAD(P) transhydrogenase subunit alpha|nr:Re/Si-specific NAD(P)(+) transhydrogenase subunit alpha [Rickettsiales bacterium]